MKFILSLVLSVGAFAQTTVVTAPATVGQTVTGGAFDAAYYQAQNPIKAPLYNGRPGSVNPTAAPLDSASFAALINTILGTPGVSLDEQIDAWGWSPLATMQQRQLEGIAWVPQGLGGAQCSSILTPGCVVTPGMYSGTPPAGSIVTCVTIQACGYTPWPTNAPPTPVATPVVGSWVYGPYYLVLQTPAPVLGTKATGPFPKGTTSCTLTQVVSYFMIGQGFMNVWNCQ